MNREHVMNKRYLKIKFIALNMIIFLLVLLCMRVGSINLSLKEIVLGLISGKSQEVEIIRVVRLPRIFVSLLTGAMLATSGVLLQAVMKNPLADPGIIGISAGANFMSKLVLILCPTLFLSTPLFSLLGGLTALSLIHI